MLWVIIAPDSEHQELRQPANIQTYKSRWWRRAEQVSFFCSQGLDSNFIMTEAFERVPADRMDDVAALFEGSMTFCTRRHAGGACCDKESLVLPMLGMYFDLCIRSTRSSRAAHSDIFFNVIQDQKPWFFPRPTLTSRRQETWCARSSLANRQLSWIASSS